MTPYGGRPEPRAQLDQQATPGIRMIAPRQQQDVNADATLVGVADVTALSAGDVTLFKSVSGCVVCVRNFSVGGSAMFLLDSTFPAAGVLVASNGGAIWVANAAPAAGEIRVYVVGESVVVRAGATRNGNAVRAMLLRFGPGS